MTKQKKKKKQIQHKKKRKKNKKKKKNQQSTYSKQNIFLSILTCGYYAMHRLNKNQFARNIK